MVLVRGGITVKPHVQRFADAVVAEFGEGLSPGTYNGHSPPEGPTQALDLFTEESERGWALQDRICEWIIKNAKRYGVRYCIRWSGGDWIWNIERAAEGWRKMSTRDHSDHVHVTFYASSGAVEPEPEPVKPILGDVMSIAVRYIYKDETPGRVGNLDWVFDGPSRIHSPVGAMGVLKASDACKLPELGVVDADTHDWFKGVAAGWK